MFQTFTLDNSLLEPMSPWTKVFLDKCPLDKVVLGQMYQHPNEIDLKMQFILDSSVLSSVIRITQLYGVQTRDRLLYLGHTWCYNIHRERMNQLGQFRFR